MTALVVISALLFMLVAGVLYRIEKRIRVLEWERAAANPPHTPRHHRYRVGSRAA